MYKVGSVRICRGDLVQQVYVVRKLRWGRWIKVVTRYLEPGKMEPTDKQAMEHILQNVTERLKTTDAYKMLVKLPDMPELFAEDFTAQFGGQFYE